MEQHFIHINGIKYGSQELIDELSNDPLAWKISGLRFALELLDPTITSFKFNTSGTTGPSKEIVLSRAQILTSANNTSRYFNIENSSKLLNCLPTDFVSGRLMMARAFVSGAELIWVEPSLNPLQNYIDVNFAAFTPAQVFSIMMNKESKAYFKGIDKVIIGGGEISSALENELLDCPNLVFATYGMTETLTHVAVRKIGTDIYQSVYSEVVFSANEDGCLVIDLPYINNKSIFTKDLVEIMDDHSFIWKGRLDNMINTGGVKLYPESLERKIVDSGMLKQEEFYISSQQDEAFGQIPVIVMLKASNIGDVVALLQRINGLLNKYEMVKHVVFLDKFEYTPTGKLRRLRF